MNKCTTHAMNAKILQQVFFSSHKIQNQTLSANPVWYIMSLCYIQIRHWKQLPICLLSNPPVLTILPWTGLCCYRSPCHSRMWPWTSAGKSGSIWTLLRDACTGMWHWRTTATCAQWVSTAALCVCQGRQCAISILSCWVFWNILSVWWCHPWLVQDSSSPFHDYYYYPVPGAMHDYFSEGQMEMSLKVPWNPISWTQSCIMSYQQGTRFPNQRSSSNWSKERGHGHWREKPHIRAVQVSVTRADGGHKNKSTLSRRGCEDNRPWKF